MVKSSIAVFSCKLGYSFILFEGCFFFHAFTVYVFSQASMAAIIAFIILSSADALVYFLEYQNVY